MEHVGSDVLDGVVRHVEVGQFGAVDQGGVGKLVEMITGQWQRFQMGPETGQVAVGQRCHIVIGQVEETQPFQVIQSRRVTAQMVAVQVQQNQRRRQRVKRPIVDCFQSVWR